MRNRSINKRRPFLAQRKQSGFTLFEVLAVLALSALVMMMVGSVLQLHLRMTSTRRNNVENALLARAILRHVTNDLRSTLYVDAETNEAGQTAASAATDEEDEAASNTEATAEQIDPTSMGVPGLYGDSEMIQFDISRAAGLNMWAPASTDSTAVVAAELAPKPRGSLQTVSYYLNGAQATAASYSTGSSSRPSTTFDATTAGGLIRQVVDQPISSWATEFGGAADLGYYAEMLAPEVQSLTFRYHDGTQWLESWNSYQQGGLPVAVEVMIVLSAPQDDTDETTLTAFGYFDAADSVYTTIVHLPTALPTDETEALY